MPTMGKPREIRGTRRQGIRGCSVRHLAQGSSFAGGTGPREGHPNSGLRDGALCPHLRAEGLGQCSRKVSPERSRREPLLTNTGPMVTAVPGPPRDQKVPLTWANVRTLLACTPWRGARAAEGISLLTRTSAETFSQVRRPVLAVVAGQGPDRDHHWRSQPVTLSQRRDQ